MRRFLWFVMAGMMLVACDQSIEKKISRLIKEDVGKRLFKADTYIPGDMRIDSAFSPYDDPDFYDMVKDLSAMTKDYEQAESDVKAAQTSMALLETDPASANSNEYEQAKEDYEVATFRKTQLKETMGAKYDQIVARLKGGKKFIGFKVFHDYTANLDSGRTVINKLVYFIDEKVERIMGTREMDEYDDIRESLREFGDELD